MSNKTTFEDMRKLIVNSPETHYWVTELIINKLDKLDPVDVLNDLEMLADLWNMKFK